MNLFRRLRNIWKLGENEFPKLIFTSDNVIKAEDDLKFNGQSPFKIPIRYASDYRPMATIIKKKVNEIEEALKTDE